MDESAGLDIEHEGEETIDEEQIISIGSSLIKVVRKLDSSLSGMVSNTYINCLLVSTSTLYVSSSVFYNKYQGMAMYFYCGGKFGMAILSVMRLLFLTNAGQRLGNSMKASKRTLDKIKMKNNDRPSHDMNQLKQDLKHISPSPITLFSALSLSNDT